jgi:predicted RNA binding protein YcfA (HicA-like mRNA interferase family)
VPKLQGINHLEAIRAFERIGFIVKRQSKHVIMSNGFRTITIPRNNPINPSTMADIIIDAGLTLDQFRDLL